nr:14979_t:CDS:1 [Entrophospora candida]
MAIHEFPDPPNIKKFSNATERIFDLFRNACGVTLDFKNEYFENKIESVKKCRREFHSIADDTIDQADNLVKFGGDIMILVEFYNDEDISKKDILDYLNKLSNDAITNKTAIEKTSAKIKTLKGDMIEIYNELKKFDFKNMKNIDPITYNKFKNAEFKKNFLIALSMTALILSTMITIPVAGTVLMVGFDAVEMATLAVAATTTTTLSTVGIGSSYPADKNKENAAKLQKTLNIRQKQMINKSENIQNDILSAIPILKELEDFWMAQIVELERLTEYFESSSVKRFPLNKLIIKRLEKRWKETIEECKHYSDTTRNKVEDDRNDMNN